MEIDYNTIKLTRSDLDTLHDTVGNAIDKWNCTDSELISIWKILPNDIKADAVHYGISDTPTREKIYTWLEENVKSMWYEVFVTYDDFEDEKNYGGTETLESFDTEEEAQDFIANYVNDEEEFPNGKLDYDFWYLNSNQINVKID